MGQSLSGGREKGAEWEKESMKGLWGEWCSQVGANHVKNLFDN